MMAEDTGVAEQAHKPNHVRDYADSVEAELKVVEEHVKKVRSEMSALRKQKPDDADFGPLRAAMHELSHASSLLRTAHGSVGGHDKDGRLETITPLGEAPLGNNGTWPTEASMPVDLHHGEDGLNRVAAQRYKDRPKPTSKVYQDGSLKAAPTDTAQALPVERDDVHAGKDGLNDTAAERVRHAGR